MGIDHKIRAAQPGDREGLTGCIKSAYSIYQNEIPDLPDVAAGIAVAIVEKSVWVVTDREIVVGGMILDIDTDYLVLENIAVHRDHGRKGVGKLLIAHCESECRRLKFAEIRLSTHEAMPENIALYQHLGWCITQKTGNKVHMTKKILASEI
ncbi:hypothetical protein AB833_13000 [Chromatiales bacterium (ex Bugula neritina AB1)]|nr:hypothetical protein AB833_13000 [Chromatiales bacterium (ex Bugula neritina AB1)]